VPLYLSLLAAEWGLFLYVRKGVRSTGTTLQELIGGRWAGPRDLLIDAGIALGAWALLKLLAAAWQRWLAPAPATSIHALLPRRPVEILLWIALSASAGICEELAFRGYFQRQLAALTRSPWLAVLLQGLLFGIAHSYQGLQAALRIAVYGVLFGLLALFRRSLRPGMIAHGLTDLLSGLFGI
jgi:membrane protease YdiL (CAAX protease family)